MNRAIRLLLVLLAAAAVPAIVRGQAGIQYDKIEIKTDKVAPNLYMLSGSENVDPGHPDGAGGQLYYPENHPHVHIGIGTNTFMAYSEGQQHLGGYGISMYGGKAVLKGYTTGVNKMKKTYGDAVEARLTQAVVILKRYDAQG